MKGQWKNREKMNVLFSGRWLLEVKTCFLEGIRLVRTFGESRDLVFSPSRSNLGLVSSRLAGFVRNREIYNLGMVSGPVLLKIKSKRWIFICLGSKNTKEKKQKIDEIGQMLVSGALDDTKKMRKTAADIFAKSGPEKPGKKPKQIKILSGIFPNFPWI